MFKNVKKVIENLENDKKKLKSELAVSNARVVDLVIEVEELQTKLIQKDGLPFIENANDSLREESFSDMFNRYAKEEKEVVDAQTTFSSRFMPNVKFKVPVGMEQIIYLSRGFSQPLRGFQHTYDDGSIFGIFHDENTWNNLNKQEVSIYQAIPELIPKGMVYDKESDSLVQKVCSNQMCQGEFCACNDIHSFTEEINYDSESLEACLSKAAHKKQLDSFFKDEFNMSFFEYPKSLKSVDPIKPNFIEPEYLSVEELGFSEKQVDFIISEFGIKDALDILNVCYSGNINPFSMRK